jgi:quercetin dioxygenase-like cupin family protein
VQPADVQATALFNSRLVEPVPVAATDTDLGKFSSVIAEIIRLVVKVRDEHTAGAYSMYDNTSPAGSPGPRPHMHRHHEEAFYVLEGKLTVRVGTRMITAPAGSFVVAPRGVIHQPSNPGVQPTRFLLIFSPAGMDHFFEEAAEGRMPLQPTPTDPAVVKKLKAFTEKYGCEFAEFPPEL